MSAAEASTPTSAVISWTRADGTACRMGLRHVSERRAFPVHQGDGRAFFTEEAAGRRADAAGAAGDQCHLPFESFHRPAFV
jgi:hypothetical protein